eukprot:Nitzschia sp. Nitz4//scaffold60_size111251//1796//3661//NITZ4_004133-RA/size111251-processed-gene-0.22-mRNA-1//-1//CDS//3329555522//2512//frame0
MEMTTMAQHEEVEDIQMSRYTDDPDDFEDEHVGESQTPISLPAPSKSGGGVARRVGMAALLVLLVFLGLRLFSRGSSMEAAKKLLQANNITSPEVYSNHSTPQYHALQWVVNKDSFRSSPGDSAFLERYIMAVFYFALAPSDLKSLLQDKIGFLNAKSVCDWQADFTRRSDKSIVTVGVQCTDDKQVQTLVFPTIGLTGEIPPEVSHLSHLKHMVLDVNRVRGSFPVMSSLTHLSLAYNEMDGTLPTSLGLMTNLQQLILTENYWHGSIPTQIQSLTSLQHLAIDNNEFTSGIHSLFTLTNLRELYASYNTLGDKLGNKSFLNLTKLQVLDVNNNRLEGPFPDALWTLPDLVVVDVHSNDLDGHLNEIPDEHYPVLKYIDAGHNFLGGGLPTTLNKLTKLTHLDVSFNRLEEPLPDDLSGMSNLKALLLTECGEVGPQSVPTWLTSMTDLRHISFRAAGRTGTIPEWFGTTLTKLETLDLDWNHISGTIPENLAALTGLEHLLLNRNWLEGTVPTGVSSLPSLETIMVDNNAFVGELVACQANNVIADCGDPSDGCPDCNSVTQEISCPCCSYCCYDDNEYCNMDNWLTVLVSAMKLVGELTYLDYRPTDYTDVDVLQPVR